MNILEEKKNYKFDGVVGTLVESSDNMPPKKSFCSSKKMSSKEAFGRNFFRSIVLTGLAASAPIAIIGSISRFQLGSHSSAAQLVAVAVWLLYGVYFGVISRQLMYVFEERPILNIWAKSRRANRARPLVVLTFLLGFNAIFGFIHVGQMLVDYGVCIPVK
jgi:hypothetical protein